MNKNNMFSRPLAVLLALTIALSLAACTPGGTEAPTGTSLTLDQTSLTLAEDTQAVLTATAQPEGQITWSSSDEAVLTVSGGTLLAKKPGNVTVTAALGGTTAACQVTVTAHDGSFMYLEPSQSFYPVEIGGEAAEVSFTLYKVAADGTKTAMPDAQFDYTLSNDRIAKLEGRKLTGLVSGETSIVAASGDYSATAEVRIYDEFISTPEQWCKMLSSRKLGVSYMLTQDLDFAGKSYTGHYTGAPASVRAQAFRGTLDGNGHTVKNIRLTGGYASIFGQLYSAKIRNISFENVEAAGGNVSGLATCISGQNTLVENVRLDLRFTQKSASCHALFHTAYGGTVQNLLLTLTTPGSNAKADGVDIIGTVHSLQTSAVYVMAQGGIEPCSQAEVYASKMDLVAAVNSQKLLPATHWSYAGGAELPVLMEE